MSKMINIQTAIIGAPAHLKDFGRGNQRLHKENDENMIYCGS